MHSVILFMTDREGPFSEDARNEPVSDDPAVLVPPLPVLGPALVIVPEQPVHQQDQEEGHVDEAEPGSRGGAGAGQTPGQGQQQLEDVVEVAGDAPETARQ